MIGAFVALLSLTLTVKLLAANVVAGTLPITDVSTTTPIVVTSPGHRVPVGRVLHGGIADAGGMDEINGSVWVLTPLDGDTFTVSTFDAQGNRVEPAGVNTYTGGGTISFAFPDWAILLGRRYLGTATSVATPRIVMFPARGKAWDFEPYGGAAPNIAAAEKPPVRGSAEQQAIALEQQVATEHLTFEVYVNGSGPNYGNPLNPDFEDFDATQAIVHALYTVLFDQIGGLPRAKILGERWPSQEATAGTMTQRGQQWCGLLEIQMPVRRDPLSFVPIGTRAEITVQPIHAGSTDPITFFVPPA
jgi:hypothetical protein